VVAGRIEVKNLSADERQRLGLIGQRTAAILTAAQMKKTKELPEL
jgi:hypothetical protein